MLDRESQTSAEELAHQQERFDIHVMAFADRSPATIAVLQRAFALDRASAERLVSAAPVVVKRGAPPEVAHALLDVLVPLGAQVVLLPAPPSVPPALAGEQPSEPAPAPAPRADAWGGLDLDEPAPAHGAAVESESSAASGAPDPLASTVPPPPAGVPQGDGDLEFDLAEGDEDGDGATAALSPDGEDDDDDLPSDRPARRSDLGLGQVPPLPRLSTLYARTSARALSVPPPPIPPVPVPGLSHAPPPLPPPPPPSRTVSIPPHRAPSALRPPAAPRTSLPGSPRAPAQAAATFARALPAAPTGPTRGPRMIDAGGERSLAPLELALGRERRDAPARGATHEASRARRAPELEPPSPASNAASLTRPVLPDLLGAASERPAKPEPATKPAAVSEQRPRGLAVLGLLAAAAVVYFGLQLDDTVLHGNASLVSLAAHGFAFYAFGAGLAGLRP